MSYGAATAKKLTSFTLEEMLTFALEDEYLARQEYEIAIETFGEKKPFPSIIASEVYHITWLKELFTKYGYTIPADDAKSHLAAPDNFITALEEGIHAEIENIEMYETFLAGTLPEDVATIFKKLRDASKGHLLVLRRAKER